MTTAAPMAMMVMMGLTTIHILGLAVAMHPSQHSSKEEHDGVHDAKGKRSLEHSTRLVRQEAERGALQSAQRPKVNAPVAVARNRRAVLVGDVPERVHAAYECAYEEEVDCADEEGVGRTAVVVEESEEGPCEGYDGDDEEDKDVIGC